MTGHETYEDRILDTGHYVGLVWKEGVFIVQVRTKEICDIEIWGWGLELGAAQLQTPVAAGTVLNGLPARLPGMQSVTIPTPVRDQNGNYYLLPEQQETIKQIFWGASPGEDKFYLDYPSGQDMGALQSLRPVGGAGPAWTQYGKIGAWRGDDTPLMDPSPESEMWTVFDGPWPTWWAHNPTQNVNSPLLSFRIRRFTYNIVRDNNLLKEFLSPGGRRIRMVAMGPVPVSTSAPQWIRIAYKDELEFTTKILKNLSTPGPGGAL